MTRVLNARGGLALLGVACGVICLIVLWNAYSADGNARPVENPSTKTLGRLEEKQARPGPAHSASETTQRTPTPRPTPVTLGQGPATTPAQEEAALWLEECNQLHPEQLDELARTLVHELHAASVADFEMRLNGGMYEVIGKGNEWDGTGWDESLVMHVQVPPEAEGEIRRVILSEAEFPDFYYLKRKILWTRERAKALRAEQRLAKVKK